MAVHSSPARAGDIDALIDLLRAACDEADAHRRLHRLLSTAPGYRGALIDRWLDELERAGVSSRFSQAVACLREPWIADRARTVLESRPPPSRGATMLARGILFGSLAAACTALAALALLFIPTNGCRAAEGLLAREDAKQAAEAYSTCLAWPALRGEARAAALRGRSWANALAGRPQAALQDQADAFALQAPVLRAEVLRYAVLLRESGLAADSLAVLEAVRAMETTDADRLATAHHRGWALKNLGRAREAVEELSVVIRAHPGFLLATWNRAQAHEALGERELARQDLERCAEALARMSRASPALTRELPALKAKLREQGFVAS